MKKSDILWEADYRYNFDRDLYVNRAAKKAFSVEFVGDHSEDELRQRIVEHANGNGWTYYFNSPPSEGVKQALESVL